MNISSRYRWAIRSREVFDMTSRSLSVSKELPGVRGQVPPTPVRVNRVGRSDYGSQSLPRPRATPPGGGPRRV